MGLHGQNDLKARKINSALNHYAQSMTNKDIHVLRDALSHHLSHYKKALENGNREVADAHLEKVVPLIDLAARSTKNSGGLASFKAPNPMAWEMNYTTNDRKENGEWHRDPKGWGARASKKRVAGGRPIPDYRYFEMPPHAGHSSHEDHMHRGGYPFEEIQIGKDSDINEGKAHLHEKDVVSTDTFTPHPFDSHPIHKIFASPKSKVDENQLTEFVQNMNEWNNSSDAAKAHELIKKPLMDAHQKGGHKKGEHLYTNIKLLDQPEEAKKYIYKENRSKEPKIEQPKAEASTEAMSALPEHIKNKFIKPSPVAQPTTTVEKPKSSKLSTETVSALPEHLKRFIKD